jgi:NTP pyrophosphatase (non-canonical NTP hydrolase)
MKGRSIFQAAVETWGRDAQLDMAIEEMSELTKAILKLRRAERNNTRSARDIINRETKEGQLMIKTLEGTIIKAQEELVGEWADVHLMLAQIRFMVPGKYEYALEDKIKAMQGKLRSYGLQPGEDYDDE